MMARVLMVPLCLVLVSLGCPQEVGTDGPAGDSGGVTDLVATDASVVDRVVADSFVVDTSVAADSFVADITATDAFVADITATDAFVADTAVSDHPDIADGGGPDERTWKTEDGWAWRQGDDGWDKFLAVTLWRVPCFDLDQTLYAQHLIDAAGIFNGMVRAAHMIDDYVAVLGTENDMLYLPGLTRFNWKFRRGSTEDETCPIAPIASACPGTPGPTEGTFRCTSAYTGPGGIDFGCVPVLSAGYHQCGPSHTGSQVMRADLEGGGGLFAEYLRTQVVDPIVTAVGDNGLSQDRIIWITADEPDVNYNNWYYPPSLIDEYNAQIKGHPDIGGGGLTFVGLSAVRGNLYSFEQLATDHGRLPFPDPLPTLPAEIPHPVDPDWRGSPELYESYAMMIDGSSKWRYCEESQTWQARRDHYYLDSVFETVKVTAQGYAGSGDIMGLNSYPPFLAHPELAGTVVDAIKEGAGGGKPVWLYFNGSDVTGNLANIRAQIFTSLVHGATGVQFFVYGADCDAGELENWENLKALATEVQQARAVFVAPELARDVAGTVHFSVRQLGAEQMVVAVNTSTDTAASLPSYALELEPLEVVFAAQ